MLTVLSDIGEHLSVIKEIEQEWLNELIALLGADIEEMEGYNEAEMFEYFLQNNLEIVNNTIDGSLQVFYQGSEVGRLSKPTIEIMRSDDNKLYYKIEFEEWIEDLEP